MLPFRLRPLLRTFLSRTYSSPSFLTKPLFARPYLWWLKARYREDGTRRSILLGIYSGACYAAIAYIAYHRYPQIKARESTNAMLSNVAKLQYMHRKYRTSSFTEPAEVKAYLTELAESRLSELFLGFCKDYDAIAKTMPERCERVRERIIELRDLLSKGTQAFRQPQNPGLESFFEMTVEVEKAINQLGREILDAHSLYVKTMLLEMAKSKQELAGRFIEEEEKSKEEGS